MFAMLHRIFFFLVLLYISLPLFSQAKKADDVIVMKGKIENGDTILYGMLPEVFIFPKVDFRNPRDYRRYQRLIRDVKKVYPYAKLAGNILLEFYDVYSSLSGDVEKARYAKQVEEELLAEFEDELKKLNIRQGRLLMKLIHRETGNTTYDIVKEFRGGFSAFFWQTLARLFGSNMKANYDPLGDDYMIEQIVLLVEAGQL
jgi:hypothetical protein